MGGRRHRVADRPVQNPAGRIARRSGHLSQADAGRLMGMCARRARQIHAQHRRDGRVPILCKPGRRPKTVPPAVMRTVLAARRAHRAGAPR